MKKLLAVALALAALAGAPSGTAATIETWINRELDAIAAHRTNPPRAARGLALLSVALDRTARRQDSSAAMDAAATEVLNYLYPDLALPPGVSERGRSIGRDLVARAQADGSDIVWAGTVPVGAGLWIPTPPLFAALPLEPLAGTWRSWNLRSGSEFRPGPPPAFGSARFLAERDQVLAVSRSLTAEQRAIALFWADGAGTVTPPGHWNRIALDLIRSYGLGEAQAAHLLAILNTAQADAFIASWDAKYEYWTMRPVSAIRAALDPGWTPLIATPPFPSYVSGHSATSGAASLVLAVAFPREAGPLLTMADEAAASRLYAGIHFPSDNAAGLSLGRKVGVAALFRYQRLR